MDWGASLTSFRSESAEAAKGRADPTPDAPEPLTVGSHQLAQGLLHLAPL
jgi:hypothetical protein